MTDAAPAERSPGPRRFGELGPTQSTSNVSTRSSTTGPLAQDIARADAPNGRDTPPVPGAFITAPSPAHVHGRPRSARASTFTSTSGSWHTALPDDLPNAHTANAAAETAQGLETPSEQQATGPRLPWISRMLAVFGRGRAGSRRRKALVSLIVASVEGSAQIVTIIVLVAYSAHKASPTRAPESEWDACERPLGAWNVIWLFRTLLMCFLAVWNWQIVRYLPEGETTNDAEAGQAVNDQQQQQQAAPTVPPIVRRARSSPAATASAAGAGPATRNGPQNRRLVKPPIFTRLSLLCSLLSLTWFITAHFLVYTSIHSCRHSAPHLWWLTFSILCITYVAIVEAFIIGLVVLIIFPLLFVFLNIVLLCLGRHPIQNPLGQIKPTIGKLPKAAVDKLPLVMYIPAPPEEENKNETGEAKPVDSVTVPKPAYAYPPTSPSMPQPSGKKRFRFAFLRRKKSAQGGGEGEGKAGDAGSAREPQTWEENWVPSGLPFVRLEGNRAACAICLMDYEEPPRAKGSRLPPRPAEEPPAAVGAGEAQHVRVEEHVTDEQLRLVDAGEVAQPLRLLPCGHVFHSTCLDPWLTEVSGRCPVCQRPVEIPDLSGKKKRRQGRRQPEP